ncbi:MAG: NAD-dependent epimerase/dehydratase family protein [Cetobacterium sp.]
MEKIILFGGFGFIGKNLCEYLQNNYEIVIIDKIEDLDFLKRNPGVKSYSYNFDDKNLLNIILEKENPDYIINLISVVTAERDLNLFSDMIESNLNILLKIYEASKNLINLKLMIQFGSGEEYGNIVAPFEENDKEEPNSPYGISKLLTTNTGLMLHRNNQYPICIVRPSNLFGKYQSKNKFVPYIINQLKNNLIIETTPGEQKRDFIGVNYFSKEIEILLRNFKEVIGSVYNLGTGESLSLKEIIEYLKEKLNSKSEIIYGALNYRDNEIMDFKLNINKLKTLDKDFKLESIKNQLLEYVKGEYNEIFN